MGLMEFVTVAMMILKEKFVSVVSIVFHAEMNVQLWKGVEGNPQKNVSSTVRRSGVVASALVVLDVENARGSVRIMKDVAFRGQDGANETVRKGLVSMESVKVATMTLKLKFALAVILVVHANVNAKITRDVVGNLQESAKGTVRRSGVLVKLF